MQAPKVLRPARVEPTILPFFCLLQRTTGGYNTKFT